MPPVPPLHSRRAERKIGAAMKYWSPVGVLWSLSEVQASPKRNETLKSPRTTSLARRIDFVLLTKWGLAPDDVN